MYLTIINMISHKYQFITDPNPEEIEQITALYREGDWWDERDNGNHELIRRIVSGSHCFVTVRGGNEIVGMGRAISDRVNDAYIHDVTVSPRLRHQGIGTRIVEEIVDHLRNDNMRWIGLIAQNRTHSLYRKIGFEEMPFSLPMLLKIDYKR
ncbi:MAG: GNAT family N-acetyltransferase [Syntrophales bacterium]